MIGISGYNFINSSVVWEMTKVTYIFKRDSEPRSIIYLLGSALAFALSQNSFRQKEKEILVSDLGDNFGASTDNQQILCKL